MQIFSLRKYNPMSHSNRMVSRYEYPYCYHDNVYNFKKLIYPINPFDDGVWIEASRVPPEVFVQSIKVELILRDAKNPWLNAIKNDSSEMMVRVDAHWIQTFKTPLYLGGNSNELTTK
ncbi:MULTISPECIES: hypothetical protein [unclassified Microcoleus]|uniref:hypothetical protein n=2 Tax=unclassified Microcoleus TaxID=2642155 RepID=UPI002FCE71A7